MQYWLSLSVTPTSSTSTTRTATPTSQPSVITTPPSSVTQNSTVEPSIKDYIPVPIVGVIIAGLIGIIATLIWKWHEAEIKRIEVQKNTEIESKKSEIERLKIENNAKVELLEEQKKREVLEKDNEIKNLEAKIESLERAQEEFRQLTTILPQEYFRETRPLLEKIITELKEKLTIVEQEKDSISEEKKKLQLELESKLSAFENSLQKLSILEEHLSERAVNIHKANLWIKKNKERLAREACEISLHKVSQRLNYYPDNLEHFISDVEDYLMIISECLNLGRTNLLDKAKVEIPPIIHSEFYAEVFRVINDEKAPTELSNEDSVREVQIYLSYLTELFQIESS